MQVTVEIAEEKLSELVEAVLRGEEVVIARGDVPVVNLIPVENKPFRYGLLEKELKGSMPDFEPISDEELDRWEREKEERLAEAASSYRPSAIVDEA